MTDQTKSLVATTEPPEPKSWEGEYEKVKVRATLNANWGEMNIFVQKVHDEAYERGKREGLGLHQKAGGKIAEFISNQKDLPEGLQKVINENFWDLLS